MHFFHIFLNLSCYFAATYLATYFSYDGNFFVSLALITTCWENSIVVLSISWCLPALMSYISPLIITIVSQFWLIITIICCAFSLGMNSISILRKVELVQQNILITIFLSPTNQMFLIRYNLSSPLSAIWYIRSFSSWNHLVKRSWINVWVVERKVLWRCNVVHTQYFVFHLFLNISCCLVGILGWHLSIGKVILNLFKRNLIWTYRLHHLRIQLQIILGSAHYFPAWSKSKSSHTLTSGTTGTTPYLLRLPIM